MHHQLYPHITENLKIGDAIGDFEKRNEKRYEKAVIKPTPLLDFMDKLNPFVKMMKFTKQKMKANTKEALKAAVKVAQSFF